MTHLRLVRFPPTPRAILEVAALLVIALGLVAIWSSMRFGWFSPDDFQHAHNGWLTSQGRVIYRDYFDNHGPLFAWLNGAILGLLGEDAPSFDSILVLRRMVFGATCGLLVMTAVLGRALAGTTLAGLVAAAMLGGSFLLADSGQRLRPDVLQALLLLAAAWLYVGPRRPFSAGILLGLDFITHPKGLLGIVAVVVATVISRSFSQRTDVADDPDDSKRLRILVLGAVLPVSMAAVWLWRQGSLGQAWHDALGYNLQEVMKRMPSRHLAGQLGRARMFAAFLADLPMVAPGIVGASMLAWRAIRRRGFERREAAILVATSTLIVLPAWLLPLYPQAAIVTLPFLAVASLGLVGDRLGPLALLLALSAATASWRVSKMPTEESSAGREDGYRRELQFVLDGAPRNASVLFFWPSSSPAYVFNENPERLWMLPGDDTGGSRHTLVNADHAAAAKRLVEERLLQGGVDWVVVDRREFTNLSERVRAYLNANFDVVGSAWHRRASEIRNP